MGTRNEKGKWKGQQKELKGDDAEIRERERENHRNMTLTGTGSKGNEGEKELIGMLNEYGKDMKGNT